MIFDGALIGDFDCETIAFDVTKEDIFSETVRHVTGDNLEFVFDLNRRGMIETMQEINPAMKEHQDGPILNIASIASLTKSSPNRCTFGLTNYLAADYMTGQNVPIDGRTTA